MLVERAKRLLETGGVPYEVLPHREAYTAQGIAAAATESGRCWDSALAARAAGRS